MCLTVPSAAPRNFTVENATENELELAWQRPVEMEVNGFLRHYNIQYFIASEGPGSAMMESVSADTLNTTLLNLDNFTAYNVSIAAFTIGDGPYASEVVTTLENGTYMHACMCAQLRTHFHCTTIACMLYVIPPSTIKRFHCICVHMYVHTHFILSQLHY